MDHVNRWGSIRQASRRIRPAYLEGPQVMQELKLAEWSDMCEEEASIAIAEVLIFKILDTLNGS